MHAGLRVLSAWTDHPENDDPQGIHAAQEEIYAMLKRRPCTAQEIAVTFSMHLNEVSKYLGKLLRDKQIRARVVNTLLYMWWTAKRTLIHHQDIICCVTLIPRHCGVPACTPPFLGISEALHLMPSW
jgi:hypothetical protein